MALLDDDITARLPAETLSAVIDSLDERADLHTTAHVCSRWRAIAFAHPRRHCWFECDTQIIMGTDEADNALGVAQLRCRADHQKHVNINFITLNHNAERVEAILTLLPRIMPRIFMLTLSWRGTTMTERVLGLLTSHPAPQLKDLQLSTENKFGTWEENEWVEYATLPPSVPANLFTGTAPALTSVKLTGIELPDDPLPQFAAVTEVYLSTPREEQEHIPSMEELVAHFPAVTDFVLDESMDFRVERTMSPALVEILSRLSTLHSGELVFHELLDACPQISAAHYITVRPVQPADPVLALRTLTRALSHVAHTEFRIEFPDYTDRDTSSQEVCISSELDVGAGAPHRIQRSLTLPTELLERGALRDAAMLARDFGRPLRMIGVSLSGRMFALLWPSLPLAFLRTIQLVLDPVLPDIAHNMQPLELPNLQDIMLCKHSYWDDEPPNISVSAESLGVFLRATIQFGEASTTPRVKLRLAQVTLDSSDNDSLPDIIDEVVIQRSAYSW